MKNLIRKKQLSPSFVNDFFLASVMLQTVNYVLFIFFKLTAKNIQCMRTLLNLAHCHGAVLGTSWQLVLATLQVPWRPCHTPFFLNTNLCNLIKD